MTAAGWLWRFSAGGGVAPRPPWGHRAVSEDFLSSYAWVLLASRGWRTGLSLTVCSARDRGPATQNALDTHGTLCRRRWSLVPEQGPQQPHLSPAPQM